MDDIHFHRMGRICRQVFVVPGSKDGRRTDDEDARGFRIDIYPMYRVLVLDDFIRCAQRMMGLFSVPRVTP